MEEEEEEEQEEEEQEDGTQKILLQALGRGGEGSFFSLGERKTEVQITWCTRSVQEEEEEEEEEEKEEEEGRDTIIIPPREGGFDSQRSRKDRVADNLPYYFPAR